VLYGDTADATYYVKLLCEGTNIAAIRDGLMFGVSSPDAMAHA